uniref:dual specificity protein kinase TTK n=1 Tax=Myxine glutinosa TaxID=7769 RepID=UPI00358E539C
MLCGPSLSQLRLELESLRTQLNENAPDSCTEELGQPRVQGAKFVGVHEDAAGRVKPSCRAADLSVKADPFCEFSSHQWLVYLTKACAHWEKDGRPDLHYVQLCGLYKKALDSVPKTARSSSSDYAQMCVDYIRLKALNDPARASVLFSSACETFQQFAFVHVAAAQFALSKDCPISASTRSRSEVSRSLLLRGLEVGAMPHQLLLSALQTLSEASQKLQEHDKENLIRGFAVNEAAGVNSNTSPLKADTEEKTTSDGFVTCRDQIEHRSDTSNVAWDVPPHALPRPLEHISESVKVDTQPFHHGGLQEKHILQSDTDLINQASASCLSKGRVSDCEPMESDAGQQERGSGLFRGTSGPNIDFSSSLSTRRAMRVTVLEQQRVLNQEIDMRDTSVGLATTTQSYKQANVSLLDSAFPETVPSSVSSQASSSIMKAQAQTDDHQSLDNSESFPGFQRSSSSSLLSQDRRLPPCPTACLTGQPLQCFPTPVSLPSLRKPPSSTPCLSKPFITRCSTPACDQQAPSSNKSSLGREQVQTPCSSNPLLFQPTTAQQKGNTCISVNGKAYQTLELLGEGGTSKAMRVTVLEQQRVLNQEIDMRDTSVGLATTTQSYKQANVSLLVSAFPETVLSSVSSQASSSIMKAQAQTDDHQSLDNSESFPGFKCSSSSSLLSQDRRLPPCPTACLTGQPLQCFPTPVSLPSLRKHPSSTPCLSKPFITRCSTPACDQQAPSSNKSSLGRGQVQTPCSSNPLLCQPTTAQQKGNTCISVNGKAYQILKLLGEGGTSKVYQVYDAQAEEVRAVKCVQLDTADPLIRETIAKEIQFLQKLQSCSDMIIRLYSHEMTENYVMMVMECGSIDLSSWLNMERKRLKPEDRSFYWRNMVEAVSAIHKQEKRKKNLTIRAEANSTL